MLSMLLLLEGVAAAVGLTGVSTPGDLRGGSGGATALGAAAAEVELELEAELEPEPELEPPVPPASCRFCKIA